MHSDQIIVDIRDLLRVIDPERRSPPSALEVLVVRAFMKAYSIPCISASLLDEEWPNPSVVLRMTSIGEQHRLAKVVAREGIDLLDYIPCDQLRHLGTSGLFFRQVRDTLMVGSSRAIKYDWGYHRH